MKTFIILAAFFSQTLFHVVNSDNIRFDERIVGCIPEPRPSINTLNEYNNIQIVTDLIHLPLRDIAKRPIVSEKSGNYNRFLTCSWMKYGYQTRNGEIVFDAIERALREALIREVGGTGPGINLSKVMAKRIIEHCKNINGVTPGLKVVRVQNCILQQIEHLGKE